MFFISTVQVTVSPQVGYLGENCKAVISKLPKKLVNSAILYLLTICS